MRYVAIDFETADKHHICAVGIVTMDNGEIVDEYYTLVQPPFNEYNWRTIQVHGISPQDTEDAPLFTEIYPEVEQRLKGQIVVAHNEGFDRNVLSKTMADYRMDYSELELADKWQCTMKMAKKAGYASAKLDACCERHNIPLVHHEALSDARACGILFHKLMGNVLF